MITLRLQRAGRRGLPFYRVVCAEKRRAAKGKFQEKLGYINRANGKNEVQVNWERVAELVGNGAGMSETLARLAAKNGVEAANKFFGKRPTKPSRAEAKAKEQAKKAAEEAAEAAEKAKEEAEKPAEEGETAQESAAADENAKEEASEEKAEEKADEAPADEAKPEEAEAASDASEEAEKKADEAGEESNKEASA